MDSFVDAQKCQEQNPDTFDVPSIEELRTKVVVGSHVKVIHSDERFWLEVILIDDDEVTGEIANDLFIAPFFHRQLVNVELRHVMDVFDPLRELTDSEDNNIQHLHAGCN